MTFSHAEARRVEECWTDPEIRKDRTGETGNGERFARYKSS